MINGRHLDVMCRSLLHLCCLGELTFNTIMLDIDVFNSHSLFASLINYYFFYLLVESFRPLRSFIIFNAWYPLLVKFFTQLFEGILSMWVPVFNRAQSFFRWICLHADSVYIFRVLRLVILIPRNWISYSSLIETKLIKLACDYRFIS